MPRPGSGHITTIDSHTAGHPTRVVTGGLPVLRGASVRERMDYFAHHHDRLRTFILHEPRGHAAQVGVVMTESDRADFGAFFLGSYNYLDMCGHASIGLAITLDHMGLIERCTTGLRSVSVEVPAGIITMDVAYRQTQPIEVTLRNVPSFVAGHATLGLDGTQVEIDIAYGGNWYALVSADAVCVDLTTSGVGNAMTLGAKLKTAINADIATRRIAGVSHPVDSILFYHATREGQRLVSRQLVVLGSNKFDRSPCGTGTSARLAQLIQQGEIMPGEMIVSRNILGLDFTAVANRDPEDDQRVLPSISGSAFITGCNSFLLQDGDPLERGFLCR